MSGQKNVENIYPLAPAQQGMLFHSLYEPESRAYLTQVVCRAVIDDPACFERAWEQVVQRHSILRSAMLWENLARPMQAVGRRVTLPVTHEDWRGLGEAARSQALRTFLEDDRRRGFKLSRAPLMRLTLQRLSERDYQFVWTFHHILLDGWSLPLVFGDLLACYAAALRGESAALPPTRPYADYIAWLQQQDAAQAEKYWKELLAGFGGPGDLGIPTTRKLDATGASGSARARLSESETAALQALAQDHRLTLSTIVHAAWGLVLSQYSGETDVVFGTTVSGRPASFAGVESMVGVFINVLPSRLTLVPGQTVAATLDGLQRQLVRSTDFQHTPLLDIQRWSGLGQRTSLFDTVIAFENYPVARSEDGAGALKLKLQQALEKTNYPISIIATPGRQLSLSVLYDTGLYDAADMERLAASFRNAVLWIAGNMNRPISQATLVDAADRELVTATWNATAREYPADLCLHEMVERQVRRTPDAPALRLGRTELSYSELNARANQLARFLRTRGVGPEVLVGICLHRSLDLIVAMLAVLKAGGAYVPIDPDLPEGRLAFMLDDSAVPVLLTHSSFIEKLGSPAMPTFCVDTENAFWSGLPAIDLPPAASSGNLAYTIYTSGSTGRPKGAMNAHRGIVNRILWMQDEYGLAAADRMLQKAPFSFDVSLWEIFWPLSVGALVVVAPPGVQRHAEELIDVIAEHGVTHAHFVPSMLQLFLESADVERCTSLTRVFSGGEPLTVALQHAFFARLNTALVNQYGPTETAVDVTWWPCVRDSDRAIPIGRPSANVQLYVLDRRLEPVPAGVQGELHVGGIQVARGYLNRAALTAERFIPDPFSTEPGARLYRTGDVVRQRADGNIEYVGRIDHQVKIRGNRIELGEIEKRVIQHPAVKDVVVAAREDQPGNKRLVCYAVCGSAQPTTSELRRFVADALPDYMVPSAFVFLDALPRFLSGKIDRRALPAPAADRPNLEQAFAPPQTDVEEKLAGVWEEVLRVDRVGVHDNFFELGGDSILSLQIVWKANQRGIRLTPRQLFEHPTIAELAAVAVAAVQAPVTQEAAAGRVPLTPIAHRFFEQQLAAPSHFNQAVLLEVRTPVNESVFRRAASALVEHHDALRLSAREDGSTWIQEIAHPGETPLSFERVNLAGLARAAQDARIHEDGARLQASLDLSMGPIVRFALFDLGPRRAARLLIVVHHLAIDVVSWRVLLDDLETVCGQIVGGAAVELPARTTPFRHWAERLATYARSTELGAEAAYWLRATSAPQVGLPVDHAEGLLENTTARTRSVVVELSARETKALLQQVPKAYGGDVPDVLLTAAARIIGTWMGSPTVVVDLEGHGREPIADDLDLSRTVGWFTTVFPVALEAGHDRDLGAALRWVKEALRAIPRKGIGYGLLRYLAPDPDVAAQLAARPQPQISFNYLGRFDDATPSATRLLTAVDAPIGPASSPNNARAHLIDINAVVRHGRLSVEWRFCEAVHDVTTVDALATEFMRSVRQIVAHCAARRTRAFSPSDFPLARIGQRALDALQSRYGAAGIEDLYTPSPMQQGMLYHTLANPTPAEFVSQVSFSLEGPLNRPAFREAWQQVVNAHAVLRSAFVLSQDEMHQVVCRRVSVGWVEDDWRRLTPDERKQRFDAFIDADRRRGFDLEQPPLLRVTLLRFARDVQQLVLTLHHSIMDGWSLPLVLQDVFTAYDAMCAGRDPVLPARRPFRDYIAWLRRRDTASDARYWRDTLRGFTASTKLPTATPASAVATSYAIQGLRLPQEPTAAVQRFARGHNLTLNTVIQGAWAALLARHSGDSDVVYGTTVSGRPIEISGVDSMIGVFINTLPMRVRVEGGVAAWLARLQEAQLQLRDHEYTPLVDVSRFSEVGAGQPLFDSLFVFENYPVPVAASVRADGLRVSDVRGLERVNYPLAFVARAGAELSFQIIYDRRRFDDKTIGRLLGHLRVLVEAMAAQPAADVAALGILTATETEQQLLQWTPTLADQDLARSIASRVERRAAEAPDAVAMVWGAAETTYESLNRQANQLASHLRRHGVRRGSRVAVCFERGPNLVTGLLAVLKAGGAYVPLDPEYPRERLAFMLEDTAPRALLTEQRLAATLPPFAGPVVRLDAEASLIAAEPDTNLAHAADAGDIAYVMYTSGSTGRPKGVAIPQRGIARLIDRADFVRLTPSDVIAQASNASFDAATFEIWGALVNGARLVGVPKDTALAPVLLAHHLRAHRVTTLFLTTALFNQVARECPDAFASLDHLLFGGEAVDPRAVAAVLASAPPRRLLHVYGPTENTTFSTWHLVTSVPDGATTVPIGRAMANSSVYVLDPSHRLVPVGVAGELFVGGDGLATGYLNQPALTAERFVPSPFGDGERLYRTGDVVRWLSDGRIEFIGRTDDQVKIRGFRIEPGEIETVLAGHPAVRAAVVMAREVSSGPKRLVAYVVREDGRIDSDDLRAFLKSKLPNYMVPSAIVGLPFFPLTPNGKIDASALPLPGEARAAEPSSLVGPRSPIEEMVASIWMELLDVPAVGVQDNFFDLGGHSLLATRLMSRLRDAFGIEIPLRDVFEAPTIAEISERIAMRRSGGRAERSRVTPRELQSGPPPLSLAQRRLWFLSRFGARQYHVSAAVRLMGTLDRTALERAVREIVRRHESLRTSFPTLDGGPVQHIDAADAFSFESVDVSLLPRSDRETACAARLLDLGQRAFDLETGPLFRCALVQLGDDTHVLVLVMHHIVADGWSIGVMWRELGALYEAFSRGESSPLAEPELQYSDYAVWQQEWIQSAAVEAQLSYWRGHLAGVATLQLPTDRPRPPVQTFNGSKATALYSADLIDRLKQMSRERGATFFMTLLAAFATLLHRYADQDDIVVGTPTAGRNCTEVESLVGFFINTLVLRTDVSGNPTFSELLERVKRATLDGFAHQDVPFDRLVEALRPERDPSRNPLFQVAFALQNAPLEPLRLPGIALTAEPQHGETTRFDIELHLVESSRGLAAVCAYNTDLYDASTIARLLEHYRVVLEGIAANPDRRVAQLPLMTELERRDVLAAGATTATVSLPFKAVQDAFAEQARRTPDAIAVACVGLLCTYQDLDRRANQLANHLIERGVSSGDLVGLYLDRSVDMVVSIVAVLKAGAAYVPLDPVYPVDRIAFMLRDAGVSVVVSTDRVASGLPHPVGGALDVVCLDRDASVLASGLATAPQRTVGLEAPAYVIYTSGSTGRPKGVVVTHGNVARLFEQTDRWFGFGPDDVWTLFHSFAFDFSVWEMWGALLYGGRLVVVPYEISRSPSAFHELLCRERVTVLNQTPSAFRQLIDVDISASGTSPLALRWIVFGGEALDPQTLQPWFDRHGDSQPQLVNMYGITETTVHVTFRLLSRADGSSTRSMIGRAIPDLELYVLDKYRAPAPPGVPGELYVGGAGVARGYLNRPGLTAERFVPHPFVRQSGARLYKTGDLARRLANGDVEYLGRADHQVKIRGFRIELGEIESILNGHAAVREAVVARREDRKGDARLVAYLVPDAQAASPVVRQLRLEREGLADGVRPYELPNGLVVFHRNKNETDFLYREIFGDASYLRHGIDLPENACVFDVGANTGLFTAFALSTCPTATVFAFEPIPPVFDVLSLNARLHGDGRVHVFNCGLSDRPDQVEFTYYPHLSIMSGRFADTASERGVIKAFLGTQQAADDQALQVDTLDEMLADRLEPERVSCRLRTVSDIVREHAVAQIDLLKVDVEKSELEVLLGIDEEDWPRIRQVVVEVHDFDGRLALVKDLLTLHGFAVSVEQEASLFGTGLHNVYARRASISDRPSQAATPQHVMSTWQSERAIVEDARALVKRSLPEYMVPSAFVVLDALPMTPSGKLDRQALPAPERRTDRDVVAPASDLELAIAEIWREVLDVDAFGAHDNFFDLGGHSLLLARVHELLGDRLGLRLSIVDLFRHPTVSSLALRAEQASHGARTPVPRAADLDRVDQLKAGRDRLRRRLDQAAGVKA